MIQHFVEFYFMAKVIKVILIISIWLCSSVSVMATGEQLVSNPLNLKGDCYINPIIHSDYSDPDVVASPDGKKYVRAPHKFKVRAGKRIGAKVGFYSITPSGVNERGWIDVINADLEIN